MNCTVLSLGQTLTQSEGEPMHCSHGPTHLLSWQTARMLKGKIKQFSGCCTHSFAIQKQACQLGPLTYHE